MREWRFYPAGEKLANRITRREVIKSPSALPFQTFLSKKYMQVPLLLVQVASEPYVLTVNLSVIFISGACDLTWGVMTGKEKIPPGFKDVLDFKLVDALFGRRARRFFMGASIPDGYFKYKSKHDPLPLTEKEQMMILSAAAGNTGWHNLIMRGERYAPDLSNYACSAGGRTFPSAAGFHTSELFFTDDTGVYFFETRDAPELARTFGKRNF